jgi:3-methylcrotonyl-CoA carboxylase alpha subunit
MLMKENKIKKIFIANRGEVVRRVAFSAENLGIKSVCLVEKNIPKYLHNVVSEFIQVDKLSRGMFLDPKFMIECAKQKGCDAIHPGYGFLSENAEFASLVEKEGLCWVGPSARVIELMGDKKRARQLVESLAIPTTNGLCDVNVEDFDIQKLDNFRYPLLIKATHGGGGRGLRVVRKSDDVHSNLQSASLEALSAFANGSLIIEEFLEDCRHIEVQVFADAYKNFVIMGDRDCSLQRRHQKIIEECPAVGISKELRDDLYSSSLKLMGKVGYVSCGTVEFLVHRRGDKEEFFFLEMNTRLQVEHSVTEEVWGEDLVLLQLRVAMGQKLPIIKKASFSRHSIEARIYAEDPESSFFPSPGTLKAFIPHVGPGIRWELGVDPHCEVSESFDPMLAKVVATGGDRQQAIAVLKQALEKTIISGVKNNRIFLQQVVQSPFFAQAKYFTSSIEEHKESILAAIASRRDAKNSDLNKALEKIKLMSVFSNIKVDIIGSAHRDLIESVYSKHKVVKNTNNSIKEYNYITLSHLSQDLNSFVLQMSVKIDIARSMNFSCVYWQDNLCKYLHIFLDGCELFVRECERQQEKYLVEKTAQDHIVAPVTGRVLKVLVCKGESLPENHSCFVIESMKMEFNLKSEKKCKIQSIEVREGDVVESGQKLALLC